MKKFGELIKNNQNLIISFLIGAGITALVFSILWPKRIAKLENGEEVIATYANKKVTANDLYKELRVFNGGIDALLNIVDIGILQEKYTDEKAREEYAVSQVDEIVSVYINQGATEEEAYQRMNVTNRNEALAYFRNQYYFQAYYDDYFEEYFGDKEIKDYYKKNIFGSKDVVLYSSVSSKSDIEGVREMLKNHKSKDAIAKKYPSVVINDIDDFTFDKAVAYSDIIVNNINKHTRGEYTKVFTDDSFGYMVIDILEERDKPELDDIKKNIVSILTDKLVDSDPNIYLKALNKLRDDNNLNILDSDLKASFKNYQRDVK